MKIRIEVNGADYAATLAKMAKLATPNETVASGLNVIAQEAGQAMVAHIDATNKNWSTANTTNHSDEYRMRDMKYEQADAGKLSAAVYSPVPYAHIQDVGAAPHIIAPVNKQNLVRKEWDGSLTYFTGRNKRYVEHPGAPGRGISKEGLRVATEKAGKTIREAIARLMQ